MKGTVTVEPPLSNVVNVYVKVNGKVVLLHNLLVDINPASGDSLLKDY